MAFRNLISAASRARGALALLFGVMSLQGPVTEARAQNADYRSPDSVPASWGTFAARVKLRFEERIAADDPIANRLRDWLTQSQGKPGAPASVIVRAWINADGTVSRVSFPPLPDGRANDDLQSILMRSDVGQSPPADMLQPIHLRFSLNLPT